MHDNPHQPLVPQTTIGDQELATRFSDANPAWITGEKPHPAVSPNGTTLARLIAANIDNVFAAGAAIVAAKQIPEEWIAVQIVTVTIVYFGYYFAFESLLSTTPGKLLSGLKTISLDGNRYSTRQIAIRTLLRVLEVNPLMLGALPAAVRIALSRDKRRFGDRLAGTIVVFR